MKQSWRIITGDTIAGMRTLPEQSAHCCVTSPPYWGLRDYGVDGQIGLEETPEAHIARLVEVFREVRRVLRDDGTLWVNYGDAYCSGRGNPGPNSIDEKQPARRGWERPQDWPIVGYKPKDLIGLPWMLAFALRADGWYLRSDIIWHKPNPMPESVTDRPTKAHEYLFLLSKSQRYYYDAGAIAEASECDRMRGPAEHPCPDTNGNGGLSRRSPEPTRNKRTVWTVPTQSFPEAHFATFPEKLVEPCIKAGCPIGGVVLDPFSGSGTTGVVALKQSRSYVGMELNPEYVAMSQRRLREVSPMFALEVA